MMVLVGLLAVILVGVFFILRSLPLRGCGYGLAWTVFGALMGMLLLLVVYGVLHV